MNIALILSGGSGSRMHSDLPKQYIEVCGHPVLYYTLRQFAPGSAGNTFSVARIRIVAAKEWQERIRDIARDAGCASLLSGFSLPGDTRQGSILNGLRDIRSQMENAADAVVLIQDAARPLTSASLIGECFRLAGEHDGALPVLPMKDTLYLSEDHTHVTGLLNRSEVYAGQAPEAFRLERYLAANEALSPERFALINGSTEPAFLAGLDIAMFSGEERNYKVTTPADLDRLREDLKKQVQA